MAKKQVKKSIPEYMIKKYQHDPNWKLIYKMEDKIFNLINDVYRGLIINRCENVDLYLIKIHCKINNINYEYMISKRGDDYGFSINNIDDNEKMHEHSFIGSNKTIKNNKFYLYNFYKIIFKVVGI